MKVEPIDFRVGTPKTCAQIASFVSRFRTWLVGGGIDLHSWFTKTTQAFSGLFQCSSAMIVHGSRYQYFINKADFSHGQFVRRDYLGTEHLGWDRFDRFFVPELETGSGILVPNINSALVLIFDHNGQIEARQVDQAKVDALVFDRERQRTGSLLLVPIIAGGKEGGKRALAYLYSPEAQHFDLPLGGYAAFLLAVTAAPVIRTLLRR